MTVTKLKILNLIFRSEQPTWLLHFKIMLSLVSLLNQEC